MFDKRCKNQQTRKNGNANRLRPTAMRMPVCEAVGSPFAGSRPDSRCDDFFIMKSLHSLYLETEKGKNVRRKNDRRFFKAGRGG